MNRRPPLPRRRRLRQGLPLRRAPHERLPRPPADTPAGPPDTMAERHADDRLALAALSLENALLARELGRAQQRFSDWLDTSTRACAALEAALVRERGATLVHVTRQQVLREQVAVLRRQAAAGQAREELARRASDLRARNRALEAELAAIGRTVVTVALDDATATAGARAVDPAVPSTPRVLCVGGRARQLPVLQALVERRGGRFAHAPGDDVGLAGLLSDCDVVLLHAALLPGGIVRQVDAHCRRAGTPCVHLERLCARSFEQGLLEALGRWAAASGGVPAAEAA